MTVKLFVVGGFVRDQIMKIPSKDVDFAVECESFQAMREFVESEGHDIVQEHEEFLTLRAVVAKDHKLRKLTNAADFVMCRKDSETSDGRRPDFVEPGTIFDDLARRDFTINAIARDADTNKLIDPHGGESDCRNRRLRFVGDGATRIEEDGLRVLRGFRFIVTKNLKCDTETLRHLTSPLATRMLQQVSIERVREEVDKMFRHDTVRALQQIEWMTAEMREVIFRDGLHLTGSLRQR